MNEYLGFTNISTRKKWYKSQFTMIMVTKYEFFQNKGENLKNKRMQQSNVRIFFC